MTGSHTKRVKIFLQLALYTFSIVILIAQPKLSKKVAFLAYLIGKHYIAMYSAYHNYRKRPCISRAFFNKIEAKNQGCGLSMDTSMFGVLKTLISIHKTS